MGVAMNENLKSCRGRAKQIADHYGLESQMSIAQEECAELIQALSKLRRVLAEGSDTLEKRLQYTEARHHVTEEMADVLNLLMQLTHLLNNAAIFQFWLDYKLDRTLSDIEKEKRHES